MCNYAFVLRITYGRRQPFVSEPWGGSIIIGNKHLIVFELRSGSIIVLGNTY
jgi:hypothetical protein